MSAITRILCGPLEAKVYLSGGPPHSAPGPVGREPRKGVLPGAGRVSRAGMHVQPQNAAGGHVARCGCACAVQHRLQRRTRTAVRTGAILDAGRTCYHARA